MADLAIQKIRNNTHVITVYRRNNNFAEDIFKESSSHDTEQKIKKLFIGASEVKWRHISVTIICVRDELEVRKYMQ